MAQEPFNVWESTLNCQPNFEKFLQFLILILKIFDNVFSKCLKTID
jgi:hypothetical protein